MPDDLLKGYRRFYTEHFLTKKKLYEDLIKYGQSPKALVISCSDSRVDPAILMDCNPGDLFVVRNVANLIPPYEPDDRHHGTSAALEFGVCVLRVPNIIVLGHTQCGGIDNLMKKGGSSEEGHSFVRRWVSIAEEARIATLNSVDGHGDLTDTCGRYAILHSLQNALTFPWLKEAVQSKRLTLNGWNFNLRTGGLEVLDPNNNKFTSISLTP